MINGCEQKREKEMMMMMMMVMRMLTELSIPESSGEKKW